MGILTLIESAKSSESMEESELDKEYKNFKVDSAVIGTELESYFPDEKIAEDWDKLRNDIREFYEQRKNIVNHSRGDIGKIDFQRKEILQKSMISYSLY